MKSITALLLSVALFNGALCRSVPYGAYNNYQSSGYDTGIEEGSAVVDASGSIPPSEVPVEIGSGSGSGMDTPFFGPEDCSTLSDGLYPMSACSHQFLTCSGGIARVMDCPASLYYNAAVEACDWAESVGCPAEDVPMVPETVEGSTSGNGYRTVQEPATPVTIDTPAKDTPMEASGNNNYGSVKAEVKPTHVVEPTKPTPVQDQPMAASGNYNYGGVKVETPVPTPTIEKPIVVAPEADKPTPASGYNKVTPTVAPSTVVDVPAPRAYDTYEAVTVTPVTPPPMHDQAYGSYRASPSMDAVDLDCSSRPDGLYSLGQCSTQFLTCSGGIARVMDCPASLIYRSVIEACDWPENAGCA